MEETNSSPSFTSVNNRSVSDGPETALSPAVPAVMFAAGVFGNITALIVLLKSRKEARGTIFYRLVELLAVVDLCGTVFTSPVTFIQYAHFPTWYGGNEMCHYFSFMLILFGLATMFVVAIMALDRYIALLHPYFYSGFVTKKKVIYIILCLFTFSIVLSGLPIAGLGSNVKHYPYTWCFFDFRDNSPEGKAFSYIYALTGIIIILLITVSNVAVISTLVGMRDTSKGIYHNKDEACQMDTEIQMMVFLMGVVLIFIICWAPLMMVVLLCASETIKHNDELDLLVIRLASFNQILDPWVYILLKRRHVFICLRWIRKTVRSAFSGSFIPRDSNIEQVQTSPSLKKVATFLSISRQKSWTISYNGPLSTNV